MLLTFLLKPYLVTPHKAMHTQAGFRNLTLGDFFVVMKLVSSWDEVEQVGEVEPALESLGEGTCNNSNTVCKDADITIG